MADDLAPAAKRRREEGSEAESEIIELGARDVAQLSESFRTALPFPHLLLNKLVRPGILQELEKELTSQPFALKENDLFSFLQSGDLSEADTSKYPLISSLVSGLYGERFRSLLAKVTGIKNLSSKIDLTCSVYGRFNHLLCHDDKLSTRRIAFILYLVPEDWSLEDGGTLDLFAVDEAMQPHGVFSRIVPERNALMLFEVSEKSYHQVAEVLATDKMRLSLGGWFHGPPASESGKEQISKTMAPLTMLPQTDVDVESGVPERLAPGTFPGDSAALGILETKQDSLLEKWVNTTYLAAGTQAAVRERFEEDSCIQLHEFLLPERYAQVSGWLAECQPWSMENNKAAADWRRVGPYQRRRVDWLKEDSISIGRTLIALFRSAEMAQLLSKLTSLSIDSCGAVLRRFTQGCFTLAKDLNQDEKATAKDELDILWTAVEDDERWAVGQVDEEEEEEDQNQLEKEQGDSKGQVKSDAHAPGGQSVWAVEGEQDPLLVVTPQGNMLTLVFRSKDQPPQQSFVKFVNKAAPGPRFDISMLACVH